ncbi:MAG TPA: BtpA/SgcQ family protein [Candidatus Paceibacterota bacterium]|nr:BtpA/SgcQ family protein [Candidatus Paceibacterota bacterium]
MSEYRAVFQKRHALFAVIHVKDSEQALRNVDIARSEGADGVFLINHDNTPYQFLFHWQRMAKEKHPAFWIGINCLNLTPVSTFRTINNFGKYQNTVDGVWCDDGGIDDAPEQSVRVAREILAERQRNQYRGLHFGGVAFKHQKLSKDPAKAARLATPFMDVVTTSGDATGIAADVQKICRMKGAIGAFPLAIASGITPENVEQYMPYADCFLVASGISNSFTELNPKRVNMLAKKLAG